MSQILWGELKLYEGSLFNNEGKLYKTDNHKQLTIASNMKSKIQKNTID